MQLRSAFMRGATMLGLASAIFATTAIVAPAASAAPIYRVGDNDNSSASSSGIGDVPIIGDLVSGFENAEPEEIAVGAVQMTAGAAETVIPIIFQFVK
jgi:hypothetical protein